MIITRTWLNEFVNLEDISLDDIIKSLNNIGLEVDSVKNIAIPKGVVVGKVISKEKHQDADKLNVCQVDLGNNIIKQIVCGAKNVDAEQFVAVATVGTDLGNGFIIKDAKLRGVDSFGMICSAEEIGLPKLNDGILVLDDSIGEVELGKELSEYKILNDDIIEIELTANRGDCLSIYGVARELSTIFNKKLINITPLNDEEHSVGMGRVFQIEQSTPIKSSLIYKIVEFNKNNFNQNIALRFNLRLAIIGIKSKNIISDVISYSIHTIGVVLDAFHEKSLEFIPKKDKIKITIKQNENKIDEIYGNKLLSRVGLSSNKSILIDKDETKVILQASYIEPDYLSKIMFKYRLDSDEIYYKTSRGSEPNLKMGLIYICNILYQLDIKIYGGLTELINNLEPKALRVDIDYVGKVIGQDISKLEIVRILKSLGFKVNSNSEELVVEVPNFRHDIENIYDIIEEIVRIIGIDNIKSKPLEFIEKNRENRFLVDFKNKTLLRGKSLSQGYYEVLNYLFTSREILEKYGFKTIENNLELLNPISSELNTLRTTQLIGLLQNISLNKNGGQKSIKLFEIGTIFDTDRSETSKVTFIHSGAIENPTINNQGKPKSINFMSFANSLKYIIGSFELETLTKDEITNRLIHPYQSAKIMINGEKVGIISKLHLQVEKDFDIEQTIFAELDFDKIPFDLKFASKISKFPATTRDLSLVVDKNMEYKNIKDAINELNITELKNFYLVDIYSDELLKNNMSISIRFELVSEDKTLKDKDINLIMNNILENLNEKFGIGLR